MHDTNSLDGRPRPLRFFAAAFAVLFAFMTLWSLASPLMSVPDEPAHVIRAAAAARGEIAEGPSTAVPTEMGVDVPKYVADTLGRNCFAFDPTKNAGCDHPPASSDEIVEANTSAGPNHPLYYILVGWPTLLLSGDAALYAMRIVSSALCSLVITAGLLCLTRLLRSRWALAASAVAITPMVLYLGGAVNPNGIEIAAALSLFCALVLLFREPLTRGWRSGVLAFIVADTVLLATARSVALLWAALIVVGALLLGRSEGLASEFKRVSTYVVLGGCLVVAAAAALWYVRPTGIPMGEPFNGAGTSFADGFVAMIGRTTEYFADWVGLFGWVDTPVPSLTTAIWTLAIGGLLVASLTFTRGRARLTVIYFLLLSLVLAPLLQAAVVTSMGYIWQARYDLAIVACGIVAMGIALDSRFGRAPGDAAFTRIVQILIWSLAAGQTLAFAWALRRYVIGDPGSWTAMVLHPAWQPPGGWILLTVLFAVVAAVGSVFAARAVTRAWAAPAASPATWTLEESRRG